MNKLQQLLKNPACRFKTTAELLQDYGDWYHELNLHLEIVDILTVTSSFAGKKVYLQFVNTRYTCENYPIFIYGPTMKVHIGMLTTKAAPKLSSRGDILKPGMIATVEYVDFQNNKVVPSTVHNAPGTILRILKVVKPSDYMNKGVSNRLFDKSVVDTYCVATELLMPFSNHTRSKVESMYGLLFKDYKVRAFEISWQLRKATEMERKFYYSRIHTSEISHSPYIPEQTGWSVPFRGE